MIVSLFLKADRVRVSLLARDTKYRNIINQDEVYMVMFYSNTCVRVCVCVCVA